MTNTDFLRAKIAEYKEVGIKTLFVFIYSEKFGGGYGITPFKNVAVKQSHKGQLWTPMLADEQYLDGAFDALW